jgi:hypothetical protein
VPHQAISDTNHAFALQWAGGRLYLLQHQSCLCGLYPRVTMPLSSVCHNDRRRPVGEILYIWPGISILLYPQLGFCRAARVNTVPRCRLDEALLIGDNSAQGSLAEISMIQSNHRLLEGHRCISSLLTRRKVCRCGKCMMFCNLTGMATLCA